MNNFNLPQNFDKGNMLPQSLALVVSCFWALNLFMTTNYLNKQCWWRFLPRTHTLSKKAKLTTSQFFALLSKNLAGVDLYA